MKDMRLLDYQADTKTSIWFGYDDEKDKVLLYEEQDVEPYIEAAKQLQNDPEYSKKGIKNDWWHYGHIPMGIVHKWKVEKGVDVFNKDHVKAVLKLLNDPEYRWLKTTAGMHR